MSLAVTSSITWCCLRPLIAANMPRIMRASAPSASAAGQATCGDGRGVDSGVAGDGQLVGCRPWKWRRVSTVPVLVAVGVDVGDRSRPIRLTSWPRSSTMAAILVFVDRHVRDLLDHRERRHLLRLTRWRPSGSTGPGAAAGRRTASGSRPCPASPSRSGRSWSRSSTGAAAGGSRVIAVMVPLVGQARTSTRTPSGRTRVVSAGALGGLRALAARRSGRVRRARASRRRRSVGAEAGLAAGRRRWRSRRRARAASRRAPRAGGAGRRRPGGAPWRPRASRRQVRGDALRRWSAGAPRCRRARPA